MANGIVIRPDTEHANVAALEDAYSKMQAIAETDNRGWVYWAEFHGYNRNECWHDPRVGPGGVVYNLFLPWHRAYLVFFDNAARDQNPDAILPWWDWTSSVSHQNGLPTAYRSGGDALETGPVPAIGPRPARRTQRNPSSPGGLPTAAQVDDLLLLSDFRDFSDQLQEIHNSVHGWVGGDMGSIATAAFDPVFWAHHAMIDRIWYLWQLKYGVNTIPPEYLDMALFPGMTVQQVLDVKALGYDYASAAVAVGAGTDVPTGVAVAPGEAVPAAAGPDVQGDAIAEEPEPPTTAPPFKSDPIDVTPLESDPKRADIEFHRVDHAGPSYEGRVYINNPEADENTGYEDPTYAGSYHVFGHGGCLQDPGHCDVKERRAYDPRPEHPLTPAKKVVIATDAVKRAIAEHSEVTVTVVPVIEPLPYEIDEEYTNDPVGIGYVRIITYR
jgi:tyrosinase